MLSGSCPIIAPSNHTTFSQTQTDATVPLKVFYCEGSALFGDVDGTPQADMVKNLNCGSEGGCALRKAAEFVSNAGRLA
jgi:hypothetical protein